MAVKSYKNEHSINFTESQWEEIWNLSFEPFEFERGDSMTRGQWMAIAHMALGKAQRIEQGDYGMPDECGFGHRVPQTVP